jgi:hypothetical protein
VNYSFITSIIYSFVFIYLMSAFAEPIAWLCIVLVQIGFIAGTALAWMYRQTESKRYLENFSDLSKDQKESSEQTQAMLLAGTIIFGILSVVFLCSVCCGFKSLKLAIDTIDAAADFIAGTKRIIAVPVLFFFLIIVVLVIWSGCFVAFYSLGEVTAEHGVVPQARDVKFENKNMRYALLFLLFGLLWAVAWLRYTSNYICMVSASTYYFNSSAEKEGDAEVSLGFAFAVKNTGSIAFGAGILAAIQLIRIVFLYAAKQATKAGGDNKAAQAIAACGNCYLKCLEKICDYLNSAAFSYMAVAGTSFCSSAWNGFLLNIKHMLKFAFANLIAKVFILIGKIAITVGNCVSFYFVITYITKEQVGSLIGPLGVVGAVSFITASLFLALFDTAVMALMTCLAVDMDLHDGTPAYGPPTYHDKVQKSSSSNKDVMDAGNEMM